MQRIVDNIEINVADIHIRYRATSLMLMLFCLHAFLALQYREFQAPGSFF